MNASFTGFENPILGENAEQVYTDVFGEDGVGLVKVLASAPKEMAVIFKLLMYLQEKL